MVGNQHMRGGHLTALGLLLCGLASAAPPPQAFLAVARAVGVPGEQVGSTARPTYGQPPCGGLELDPATGALWQFSGGAPLRLPEPIPPPTIGRDAAVRLVLDHLRGEARPTRLAGPYRLLRVRRLFFVRGDEQPSVLRSRWEVEVGGAGKHAREQEPEPMYWRVQVEEPDGRVQLCENIFCDRRFVLDREVRW